MSLSLKIFYDTGTLYFYAVVTSLGGAESRYFLRWGHEKNLGHRRVRRVFEIYRSEFQLPILKISKLEKV